MKLPSPWTQLPRTAAYRGVTRTGSAGTPRRNVVLNRGMGPAGSIREKRYVAALVIGLGGFEGIDARFGPNAGEDLLFGVAERLCEVFPPPAAVARIAVDEFAALLEGLARPSNAERAGQRVLGALAPEFKLGTGALRLEASIGIALGRVAADGDTLLDQARSTMAAQRRLSGQGIRLA